MAQNASNKFRFQVFSGMTSGAWSPVKSPLQFARSITIKNPSGGGVITICTDTADANSTITLAADDAFTVQLSPSSQGFGPNEVVFFIKGAGSQPVILAAR